MAGMAQDLHFATLTIESHSHTHTEGHTEGPWFAKGKKPIPLVNKHNYGQSPLLMGQ